MIKSTTDVSNSQNFEKRLWIRAPENLSYFIQKCQARFIFFIPFIMSFAEGVGKLEPRFWKKYHVKNVWRQENIISGLKEELLNAGRKVEMIDKDLAVEFGN